MSYWMYAVPDEEVIEQQRLEKKEANYLKKLRRAAKANPEARTNNGIYEIGTVVKKSFKGTPFEGEVVEFDSENELYMIEYVDGDREDFDECDMQKYFIKPKPKKKEAVSKKRPKKKQKNK